MAETVHTPGPWFWARDKINQRTDLMRSGSGAYVASPQADMGDWGLSVDCWTDVSHADAALIAAAPDLLEVAKALVQADDARQDVQPLYDRACELARAAITKATSAEASA